MSEKKRTQKTAISYKTEDGSVIMRGYNLSDLAEAGYSFSDGMFLMLQGRLPTSNEEEMLQYEMAEFIEHSMSPSAAASRTTIGGRPLLPAAIAAAIMCFGAAHGPGAAHGYQMNEYLERALREKKSLGDMAEILIEEYQRDRKAIQGIHQAQHIYGDPRVYPTFRRSMFLGTAGVYNMFQIEVQNALNRDREKTDKIRLHPNMIGAGNSTLMDLGFSALSAFVIGSVSRGFSCAAHAVEEMKRGHPWMASVREKMVQLLDLSMIEYVGPPEKPVPTPKEREKVAEEQSKTGEWREWSI